MSAVRLNARRRPNGLWEVRVTREGRRRSFYGRTAGEAERRARQAPASAAGATRTTVADFLTDSWLPTVKEHREPSTYLHYETLLRVHIAPNIGMKRLDQLTAESMSRFYRDLHSGCGKGQRRPLSSASVRQVHNVLKAAFRGAVTKGLCDSNPCDGAELPPSEHKEREILTRSEAASLHDVAMDGTADGALLVLALTTAARGGELLALRWRDVELSGKRPQVRITATTKPGLGRTADGTRERIIGKPKSVRSTRNIDLAPSAIEALRSLGKHPPDALVFPSETGDPRISENLVRHVLNPYLRQAGVRPRRGLVFHSLRHTTATHLLEDGVPVHVVSRMLGHATVVVTLTVYAHVTGPMMDAARDAVVAMYAPPAERAVPRQPAEMPERELVAA